MTLIEALTTKRPEDGKEADWANSPTMGEYAFSRGGILGWRHSADKLLMPHLVTKTFLTSTDFTPMWKTPAPMVPMAGEVWEETIPSSGNKFLSWITESGDKVRRIYKDGVGLVCVEGDIIHGQNGWRLVYSPDPERMRRAKSEKI